jgi:uncharacterized protein with PQ loop repeat
MSLLAITNALLLALGIGTTVASTARVLRARTVEGIALMGPVLSMFATLTWVVYDLHSGNIVQLVTCALSSLGFALVLATAHHTQVLHISRVVLGLASYVCVAAALMLLLGFDGLGVSVAVLTFVNRLPQTRMAWRSPGGAGISVAACAMDALQSAMWAATGAVRGDVWTAITSLYCLANAGFVAVRTYSGRSVGERRANERVIRHMSDELDLSLSA